LGLSFQSLEEASFDDKPENNAKNLDCPEFIKAISERVAFKQVLHASGRGNIQSIEFYNQLGRNRCLGKSSFARDSGDAASVYRSAAATCFPVLQLPFLRFSSPRSRRR